MEPRHPDQQDDNFRHDYKLSPATYHFQRRQPGISSLIEAAPSNICMNKSDNLAPVIVLNRLLDMPYSSVSGVCSSRKALQSRHPV